MSRFCPELYFHVFVFEKSWNNTVASSWAQGEARSTSPGTASARVGSCSWALLDPTSCEDNLGFIPVFCHLKWGVSRRFLDPSHHPRKKRGISRVQHGKPRGVGHHLLEVPSSWSQQRWLKSWILPLGWQLQPWAGARISSHMWEIVHFLSHFLMKCCDLWVGDMKSAQTLIPCSGEATKELWRWLRIQMCLIAAFLGLSTNLCVEIRRQIISLCCISTTNRICELIAPWFCLIQEFQVNGICLFK